MITLFGAVHMHRLKNCYVNLGKVQNKVSAIFLQFKDSRIDFRHLNHLEDVYVFSIRCKFPLFHKMIDNNFRSFMTVADSKFNSGQSCRH